MSSIERRGEITSNRDNLLNQEEQNATNSIERSLREIIPAHIFNQAEEIVSKHVNQGKEQLLSFRKPLDEMKQRDISKTYIDDTSKTLDGLAAQFDTNRTTALRALKRFKVERRPTGMPRGKEVRKLPTQQVVERYEDGDSMIRLADDFEVDPKTIRNRLVREGIRIRSSEEQRELQSIEQEHLLPSDEVLATQLELGMSADSLAENYNVRVSAIRTRLKRAGVKIGTK